MDRPNSAPMGSALLHGLNPEQRAAVLSAEKRLLVLAGAGAGKTKTLIQRILHLIFEKNVKPSSILAITFTRNAANEMVDRLILHVDDTGEYKALLENKRLTQDQRDAARRSFKQRYAWISALRVTTFHGFGYNVLRNHVAKYFDNRFKIINEYLDPDEIRTDSEAPETPDLILQKVIKELAVDPEFLLRLKRYVLDFYVEAKKIRDYKKRGVTDDFPYVTLNGDHVRSKSERVIADWLYRHKIQYEYEPRVNFKDFEFQPDFYLPEADMYLEHISNLSYDPTDKDAQFKVAGKLCVKTSEKWMQDIGEFNARMDQLVRGRLTDSLKGVPPLHFEQEFRQYHEELKEFRNEVRMAINRVKTEALDFSSITAIGLADRHERVAGFYRLAGPIQEGFERYCVARSYLDFNDILLKLMEVLRDDQTVRTMLQEKFSHIMVDEYQDVNTLQVNMVDALLTPDTNLFCVGDDWQSIYGWRGSEVEHIVKFKEHYPTAVVLPFSTNYRSDATIVEASNALIANNKFKLEKRVVSNQPSTKKIQVYAAKRESEDGVERVVRTIQELYEKGFTKEDVLILYRRTKSYWPYRERFKEENMFVNARTVHAAKGMEARVVFIIGLTERYFPNVWEGDRIFQIIKKDDVKKMMEEERRLFYVAVTRAKEALYLITELGNESRFIEELTERYLDRRNFVTINYDSDPMLCDSCGGVLEAFFRLCPMCGTPTSRAPSPMEEEQATAENIAVIRLDHPRAYERWSAEEDDQLRQLIATGIHPRDIAAQLQRQPSAILSRIKKLSE
jgi:DNA helicase IV